jgi:large subunit ribosomal protein L32
MANPKQRHTKGRRDRARKQYLAEPVHLQPCPECKNPKSAHVACPNCGIYKGRKVLDVMKKVEKKAKKQKSKK